MEKTAFISGANKGIGFATAKELAKAGWKVLLGARNAKSGEQAAAELQEQGLNAEFIAFDLADRSSVDAAITKIVASEVKLIINNAGIPGEFASSFLTTTEEGLRKAFEINFFGTFYFNKKILPYIKRTGGRIINITSTMSSLGHMITEPDPKNRPDCFDYNASKTANNAMTVSMALELRGTEADVFCVTPGFTSTDLNGNAQGGITKEEAASIILKYALETTNHNGKFYDKDGVLAW